MKEGTENKMKFKKLKRRLSLAEWQCIGLLESIWKLTRTSAIEGDIGRHSNEDIAAAIEWDGDPDLLVESMVETGWLDADEEYRLICHDWSEHVPTYVKGNFAKHKKTFADIAAKQRIEAASKPAKQHDTPPKPSAKHGATNPNQSKPNQSQPHQATNEAAAAAADWDDFESRIAKAGIANPSRFVAEFREAGIDAERAGQIFGHWATFRVARDWGPGALIARLRGDHPDLPLVDGWQKPGPNREGPSKPKPDAKLSSELDRAKAISRHRAAGKSKPEAIALADAELAGA